MIDITELQADQVKFSKQSPQTSFTLCYIAENYISKGSQAGIKPGSLLRTAASIHALPGKLLGCYRIPIIIQGMLVIFMSLSCMLG